VHLVPRKATDFGGDPDRICLELQKDDGKKERRALDDMASESMRYREWLMKNPKV